MKRHRQGKPETNFLLSLKIGEAWKCLERIGTGKILRKVVISTETCFLRGKIYLNQEKACHKTKNERKQIPN